MKIGFLCVFLHPEMKKIVLVILTLIALPSNSIAQLVPLVSKESNVLSLDINRIYDYNQYEKSRWGLGLQYDIALGGERFSTLSLSGYGAYGYEDQRFKWGLMAGLQSKLKHKSLFYVRFFHDLTPEASRYLNTYQLLNFTSTGSFMTRLFSDTYRLTFGFSRQATAKRTDGFELRLSRERPLHYGTSLIYPSSYSDLKNIHHTDFIEGRLFVSHTSGLRGELLAGTHGKFSHFYQNMQPFLRLLLQYDKEIIFSTFKLDFFAQGGFANNDAPYSRLFDLGGTWGSPIALQRSLLTARPNEFVANLFTLINLKLTTQEPLFRFNSEFLAIGTAPSPFLLCNAAWGKLRDSVESHVPDKGIAEVGAGVDGLLVWGAVKWGGAVVYRLTPSSAAYHYSDTKDNLLFLFTAQLDM